MKTQEVKETEVFVTSYFPSWLPFVRDLIENNEMDCGTDIFPEFGIVAYSTEKKRHKAIGYIGGHRRFGSSGHIDIFVIDKEYRGYNIGSKLLKDMMDLFLRVGIDKYTAQVEQDNEKGIDYYESLGIPLAPKEEAEDTCVRCIRAIDDRLIALRGKPVVESPSRHA
jgi:ribosomal protein S18 acetylase RimI-like enzyme